MGVGTDHVHIEEVRRGVAPPERSRVLPRTPLGEVQESDDEEEWDVPNGADAPMTPMTEDPTDMYSPKSPEPEDESMRMGHLQALTVLRG